jgi:hypothetical protein
LVAAPAAEAPVTEFFSMLTASVAPVSICERHGACGKCAARGKVHAGCGVFGAGTAGRLHHRRHKVGERGRDVDKILENAGRQRRRSTGSCGEGPRAAATQDAGLGGSSAERRHSAAGACRQSRLTPLRRLRLRLRLLPLGAEEEVRVVAYGRSARGLVRRARASSQWRRMALAV